MSEHDRPTAVSDDERPAIPVNGSSTPTPSSESAIADSHGHGDADAAEPRPAVDEAATPEDTASPVEAGSLVEAGSADETGSTAEVGTEDERGSSDETASATEEPGDVAEEPGAAAEDDPLEGSSTQVAAADEPDPTDVVVSDDDAETDGEVEEDIARSTPSRRRKLAIIGGAAAALVLAAVIAPIAWDSLTHDDVQIATPPRLAGLVLDDSQGAHENVDYLRSAVQTGVALDQTTGAVYADEAGQSRSVIFVGGTGRMSSPDEALTKTFQLISDDSGGVENVQAAPAGPLGGVMRCGSTKTDGGSMAVCGWADSGSLGIAMFPNRSTEESAELLRTMRKAMQNNR